VNRSLKAKITKIDRLAAELRDAPESDLRAGALELVQSLMEFHCAALDRMMEIAADAGDPGWRIIDSFGRDELVSNLLLLHGLHPVDFETRVRQALEKVRPYLQSHGGNVDLMDAEAGRVRLQLIGSCSGCPSSAMTLKSAIETAIHENAPDVVSIECVTT
jgi:Fe-S cluster biogenesis protein NfuA